MRGVRRFSPALILAVFAFGAAAIGHSADSAQPAPHKFTWRDLLPRGLQKNPELGISVYTEVSPAGKKFPAPSPEHPVYYLLLDGGLVEEGDAIAGDKPPPPADLAAQMRRTLAQAGFAAATAEHAPSIAIRYLWGSYNRLAPLDPDMSIDLGDPMFVRNLRARAVLVGGPAFAEKLLQALSYGTIDFLRLQDPRYDELINMATGDLYFILAIAYAPDAAGKKMELWRTVIATDSYALAMRETLPALVAVGRDTFGRPTDVVLRRPRLHEGRVEVGEPVVVPERQKN